MAALVIALSFSLFNLRHIRICLRSTTDDATVLIITFLATLLAPLHVAIFIGVAISITLFLRKASHPFLIEYEFSEAGELREMGEKRQRPIPAISIVHVEGDLFFGAAELFRTQIQRTVSDPAIKVIILRLKNARHLDATSVMALEDLILFMRKKGLHLIVSGATREVYRVLKKSGILVTLQDGCDRRTGESNIFLTNPRNPNLSTRAALKRAQQLLGTDKADIRIFYDPSHQSHRHMKRLAIPLAVAGLLAVFGVWWFSPTQVLKRRTKSLLTTLTLDGGSGKVGRQMAVYSLNALLAAQVGLDNPTIKEANGTFERAELESAFSWLCEQAKQTRFKLGKFQSVTVTGDTSQVTLTLSGLVELPTYRPADGNFDVTFDWRKGKRRLAAHPCELARGGVINQSPRNTNSSATRFSERRAAGHRLGKRSEQLP